MLAQEAPLAPVWGQRPVLRWEGQVSWQLSVLDAPTGANQTGSELRRARVAFETDLAEGLDFRAEVDFMDFGDHGAGWRDLFVRWRGRTEVRIGHQKMPYSFRSMLRREAQPLIERDIVLGPNRELGLVWTDAAQAYTWQVGAALFTDPGLNATRDEWVFGRAVWRPWLEENGARLLHLGAGVLRFDNPSFLIQSRSSGSLRRLEAPIVFGALAAEDPDLVAVELVWQHERAHAVLEHSTVAGDFNRFRLFSAEAAWRLSEDFRPYDPVNAVWAPLVPQVGLHEGGMGAWELAARVDRVSLDGGRGNEDQALSSYTLGLQWFPRGDLVLKFNLVQVDGGPFDDRYRAAVFETGLLL